ncbi:Nif3-like dinuclear metal center hexameric protein [Paramaledivibacter caminithermalis]|jgi:putative NIF3 family GTP cyclohydrolase 1 type 2|uniref:Putative GTP cyclohydrolase 1 type 2, NIF3 family n=1 Tax=Paramaledivibacter caminithermalis (strain DSM 15212 / CIP 107654 / DViRD3) TaxID=1121301 RepID=A0A1M6N1W6_PARC5|nr:Nif3-like dinuclear metal center hexameric protein [Paramaledivibacter caminithermalis]SHJ89719.1 Putative GTP cyclohydrolase 1 type 2, NIF3 family [Paramaledivibacter caminithermalis DSM 15212]
MNTREIMNLALKLAKLEEIPADSGIAVEGEEIKKVLFGIDMETPELLLAKEIGVDCVISHHPKTGSSMIDFHKVMDVQIDKMVEFGVPINKAQKVLRKKVGKVERGMHVSNYDRVQSAAKLLNMPYLNIHMPADKITEEYVQDFLNKKFKDEPKATLKDVVEALKEINEYKDAPAGPVIRVGGEKDYAGKIAVLMAGGTNGGSDVFKAYFEAGVGTIICMHIPDEVKDEVENQNIGNVIVAGHMASDSIGLNIIIKELEKRGLEIIKMSGII